MDELEFIVTSDNIVWLYKPETQQWEATDFIVEE
jgi:hypothetical protein